MKKEVIKASGAIHLNQKVPLLEQQLWNILLANAFDTLAEQEVFEMPIEEIYKYWNYKRHDYDKFKKALETLSSTSVTYNFLEKGEPVWGVFPLLGGAQIKDGIVIYGYWKLVRERLNNPKLYAKISLLIEQRFSSQHTLSLYELCVDYKNSPQQGTPWMTFDEFRKYMGVKENSYQLWEALKKRLINPPIKEINEKSDLIIMLEIRKTGRKISEIRFKIQPKTGADQFESDLTEDQRELLRRGLDQKIKRMYLLGNLKEFSIEKVENAIQVMESIKKKENPTGLFLDAMKNSWVPN